MFLFVGLVGICFCGCENQEQKVERLIKELQDEDLSVRSSAAEALGDIGKEAKDAVPALVLLLQGQRTDVFVNATWALVKIGTPEALKGARSTVPDLIKAFKQGRHNFYTYNRVIYALAQIGTPEALKAVEEYQSRQ